MSLTETKDEITISILKFHYHSISIFLGSSYRNWNNWNNSVQNNQKSLC